MGGLLSEHGLGVVSEQGLDLGAIVWIGYEVGQLLAHLRFRQLEHSIEGSPELFLKGLCRAVVEFNGSNAKGVEHSHGGLETFVTFEMGHFAGLGHDVYIDAGLAGHVQELLAVVSVLLGDGTSLNSLSNVLFKHVLSIMLPDSLEMWLS